MIGVRYRNTLPLTIILLISLLLCGCLRVSEDTPEARHHDNMFEGFVKTDMNKLAEVHLLQSRSYLKELMIKLYKRNPEQLQRALHPQIEQNVEDLFSRSPQYRFPSLENIRGAKAIKLALDPGFTGDRVFVYCVGMNQLIMNAYGNRSEFYILDTINAQLLYNSARNIERANWLLRTATGADGQPLLHSNSTDDNHTSNLSFERLFGKMIATQDNLAFYLQKNSGRSIQHIFTPVASSIFLP